MRPFCWWIRWAAYALPCLSALNAAGQPSPAPQDSSPGRIAAKLIVLQATDANDDDLRKMSDALGAMKGVIRAAIQGPEKCVAILAAVDSPVTVDRAVRYLELAGYAVKEADDEVHKKVEAALRLGTIDVPVGIAGLCTSTPGATTPPAETKLASLAESIEPLREAFNAGKGRYRFVALLSPT